MAARTAISPASGATATMLANRLFVLRDSGTMASLIATNGSAVCTSAGKSPAGMVAGDSSGRRHAAVAAPGVTDTGIGSIVLAKDAARGLDEELRPPRLVIRPGGRLH